MNIFLWPWAILMALLPILVRVFLPALKNEYHTTAVALRVPFFSRITSFLQTTQPRSNHKIVWFLGLSWLFFVLACMRPVIFDMDMPLQRQVRNIMLVVDVSGSMGEMDFNLNGRPISRLNMVKQVADDFIQKRLDDNIGLVVFGSEAYLYAPLSFDKKTLRSLFFEVGLGIAGEQTAMGDALAMAVQGVSHAPKDSRVVILLSDGYSNAGVVSVSEAIEVAKKQQVKVYTIGMGTATSRGQTLFSPFSMNTVSPLDEKTLQHIAQETNGRYFRAETGDALQEVYHAIDQFEQSDTVSYQVRPRTELFFIPLLISMICLMVASLLKRRQQ